MKMAIRHNPHLHSLISQWFIGVWCELLSLLMNLMILIYLAQIYIMTSLRIQFEIIYESEW